MAPFRAALIFVVLLAFFLVGVPLQWLAARWAPGHAALIPQAFCRSLLALVGVDVAITGALVRGRPVLCVANHVSWIDILALGSVEPFCFLAKRDVSAWPILSAFAEVQGTVFVDRGRRRSIPPANARLAARLREGRTALIFPEGTTFGGAEPGRFMSSHLAAARDFLAQDPACDEVAVQPVALAYSSPVAAWLGDDALLPHLWRVLRGPRITCTIALGAPIPYGPDADRKIVTREVREHVVALLAAHRRRSAAIAADAPDLAAAAAARGA
jgi:lyso-ornithine lipid O-acyltransferase